jgi:hypothetical protein
MYTRLTLVVALLCFHMCSVLSPAQEVEHTDTVISYKNCTGTSTVARLEGNLFRIRKSAPPEVWEDKPVTTICYETWDGGGLWKASLHNVVDKRRTRKASLHHKEFLHVKVDGTGTHNELFIRYIANVGSEWTAYVVDDHTFRHIPKVPQAANAQAAGEIDKHIEFALHDSGTPQADCLTGHLGCCSTIYPLEPRSWIAAQAVAIAKSDRCTSAVLVLAMTQCHNPGAANLLLTHIDDACIELKKH